MDYYSLNFFGLKRNLPIISIAPKIKIASFSLLGDVEMTQKSAEELAKRLQPLNFDYLVGPEVKVVPLLFALSQELTKKQFIVCRKSVKGYMIAPLIYKTKLKNKTFMLVLDGPDVARIKNKRVIVVDDVVSSGITVKNLQKFLLASGVNIVAVASIFKQSPQYQDELIYLQELPVFTSSY
ncbi:adenine phosphoribosyltransferase [Patescibacteria group bacterium]|nr:adenine phosphoribosyltransferase [Patescibacteria group bacterium]